MMKKIVFVVFLVTLASCNSNEDESKELDWDMKKSTELNKELTVEQDIDIDLYFAQHDNWEVKTTGTGLRFVLFNTTDGEKPVAGMNAEVKYKVSLLDGTEVYQTADDELDVFKIDNSEMESGIHEGIKLMRVGEKAKLVFGSHLAHGLTGDLGNIPPISPLVVDIELIGIEK